MESAQWSIYPVQSVTLELEVQRNRWWWEGVLSAPLWRVKNEGTKSYWNRRGGGEKCFDWSEFLLRAVGLSCGVWMALHGEARGSRFAFVVFVTVFTDYLRPNCFGLDSKRQSSFEHFRTFPKWIFTHRQYVNCCDIKFSSLLCRRTLWSDFSKIQSWLVGTDVSWNFPSRHILDTWHHPSLRPHLCVQQSVPAFRKHQSICQTTSADKYTTL